MITKHEAEQIFRCQCLPLIRERERESAWSGPGGGGPDYVMRSEEWLNFVDYLYKDNLITLNQANKWTYPDFCNSPSERREKKMAPVRAVMES